MSINHRVALQAKTQAVWWTRDDLYKLGRCPHVGHNTIEEAILCPKTRVIKRIRLALLEKLYESVDK